MPQGVYKYILKATAGMRNTSHKSPADTRFCDKRPCSCCKNKRSNDRIYQFYSWIARASVHLLSQPFVKHQEFCSIQQKSISAGCRDKTLAHHRKDPSSLRGNDRIWLGWAFLRTQLPVSTGRKLACCYASNLFWSVEVLERSRAGSGGGGDIS